MADISVIYLVEIQANGNLIKLNKVRQKVLHPGKNNPMHQYILEANRLEGSLAEKALEVLMGIKSNLSQQSAIAGKAADSVSS